MTYHHQLPPHFFHMFDIYYSKNNQLIIKTKYCRTDIASNTLLHTLPLIWNPLDVSLKKSISKSKLYFIKQCKNYFINLYKSWYCDTPHCYFCRVYGGKMGSRGKMGNLRNSGNILSHIYFNCYSGGLAQLKTSFISPMRSLLD